MGRLPGGLGGRIRSRAVQRGLLGGSRLWFAVFAAGFVRRRLFKSASTDEMPVVLSERLHPGEGMVIRHGPPP